jgi:hypothetical protein
MRTINRLGVAAIVVALLGVTQAAGYGGDTHYYLRFASALETCYDWDEAHVIASADYLLDKNSTTTAEKHPVKKHNKINWHAFSRQQERFNELWERALAEEDPELQLVKLGQFLHFASDWESHYGFGVRMGHGVASVLARDPDSLGSDRFNNLRMIDQTVYHMLEMCVERGRLPEKWNDADAALIEIYTGLEDEPLLAELFDTNTPRWKKFGKRWKKGKRILAENHLRIEQLIARRAEHYPERKVPDDFTPGDPEKGLPPPIGFRYDKDGNVKEVLGVEIELLPEFDGTLLDPPAEEQFEERLETELVDDLEAEIQDGRDVDLYANVELRLEDAELEEGGWLFRFEIENLGRGASQPGTLDVAVLDVASEELLGEVVLEIPAVEGEALLRREVLVESQDEPVRRVLVQVMLDVPDLSADNNNHWFVPWRREVAAVENRKKQTKPKRQPTGAVEILGSPEMWIDSRDRVFVALTALASTGDSSRRLRNVTVRLAGTGLEFDAIRGEDIVWFSVVDLRRRLVPARTIVWLPAGGRACRAIEEGANLLEVRVSGRNLETAERTFELEAGFLDQMRRSCSTAYR